MKHVQVECYIVKNITLCSSFGLKTYRRRRKLLQQYKAIEIVKTFPLPIYNVYNSKGIFSTVYLSSVKLSIEIFEYTLKSCQRSN